MKGKQYIINKIINKFVEIKWWLECIANHNTLTIIIRFNIISRTWLSNGFRKSKLFNIQIYRLVKSVDYINQKSIRAHLYSLEHTVNILVRTHF